MDTAVERLRIAVEGSTDAFLIQSLIKKIAPDVDPSISVAGNALNPALPRTASYLENLVPGTVVVYDLEEGMIPDELPHRTAASKFVYVPAIPTLEAWLLADPNWAASMLSCPTQDILRAFESGKTSAVAIMMRDWAKKEIRHRPLDFERRLVDHFNVGVAESLSPSFGHFVETVKIYSRAPTARGRQREMVARLPNAIFANLVAELQPVTKIVYKTADGHKHTAGDIKNAILFGDELGIAYMENILRLARDFLAFQAEDDDEQPGAIDE
ncbi:hypothetical protein QPK31_23125 [Massilia sp. YIM B02769]|uniref:hypothetical protein n=1 Tax=Massilia sp. YIM B02769 TaxID=3050129 RepID=UPI0025B69D25|nr:hypothetical protein [Massilia sp. YIM B02769]MDN4061115.1 hypothetical protein [Massilia sp. YIM B02769]